MTFEDITPEGLKNSELLEIGKFDIYDKNILEIKTPQIKGAVSLFNKLLPDIKKEGSDLYVEFNRLEASMLNRQESQFLKALSRYLTGLNKIAATKFNYLDAIKKNLIG